MKVRTSLMRGNSLIELILGYFCMACTEMESAIQDDKKRHGAEMERGEWLSINKRGELVPRARGITMPSSG